MQQLLLEVGVADGNGESLFFLMFRNDNRRRLYTVQSDAYAEGKAILQRGAKLGRSKVCDSYSQLSLCSAKDCLLKASRVTDSHTGCSRGWLVVKDGSPKEAANSLAIDPDIVRNGA